MALTRRDFLATLGTACAFQVVERLLAAQNLAPPPDGRLIGTVPLGRFDGRPAPPMGTLLGTGLDARQFTDTSTLTADTLITPTPKFFIRTAATAANVRPGRWTIGLGGRVRRPAEISSDDLAPLARSMGTHLMECSGNIDPANFGLISAGRWSGVPVAAVLDRIEPAQGASLVRVTGLDDDSRTWQSSLAGASWIFARGDLDRAGAFLATGMNGDPLTRDHGAPVRLVVPNWYGCVSIKWVTALDLVADDEPPTWQMREFAARTHQNGAPVVAREFQPPVIELAAMPIRVEKWSVDGRPLYRVIGVRWGGSAHPIADDQVQAQRSVRPRGRLPRTGKHDDMGPLVSHLASGPGGPLSGCARRRRSSGARPPTRHVLLHAGSGNRRDLIRGQPGSIPARGSTAEDAEDAEVQTNLPLRPSRPLR